MFCPALTTKKIKCTHLLYSSPCLTSLTCCWGRTWQSGTQHDLRQHKRNQKPLSPASPHMNFAQHHFLWHRHTYTNDKNQNIFHTVFDGIYISVELFKNVHVCVRVCVCTWLQRILNVKHRGSVPIQHAFLHFILGQVRAAVFNPDPRLQVVKMPSVKLKKLNQQYTQVWVWTTHILSVVQLRNKTADTIVMKLLY